VGNTNQVLGRTPRAKKQAHPRNRDRSRLPNLAAAIPTPDLADPAASLHDPVTRRDVLRMGAATGLTLAALSRLGPGGGARAAQAEDAPTTTPIKHFIVLMQENHTFDNYFGTYPGVDGIPADVRMPLRPEDPATEHVTPYHIGAEGIEDPPHSTEDHEVQFNGGKMDGFCLTMRGEHAKQTMGYYDDRDLPYYWNVADSFVLFDRFFSSVGGGSLSNHTYWVTGSPGNYENPEQVPDGGWGDLPTIFDRLDDAGVPWKFYVQNYDPSINFRSPGEGHRHSQVIWVPLLNYARYLDDPRLASRIVDLDEYFVDLQAGTLPAVAYIVPSGASEHPPGSLAAGQRFVRNLITSLMKSMYWSNSAFLWTYDDWGGWYDHVPPPRVDAYGYGFRVPALMVGPHVREGHIDSTEMDFTSILKFIELNWNVPPLSDRDAAANTFMSAFDFESPPRSPVLVSPNRTVETRQEPPRLLIHAAYGSAVLGALAALRYGASQSGLLGRVKSALKRERNT